MSLSKITKIILYFALVILFYSSVFAQGKSQAEFVTKIEPPKKGNIEANEGVNALYYLDNKLYVTNSWTGLQIIDVSTPTQPIELGGTELVSEARCVVARDNYVFVADENAGLVIYNAGNPQDIKLISQLQTPGSPWWLAIYGNHVYVADGISGLQIVDITDITKPKIISSYKTKDFAWGIDIIDRVMDDGSIRRYAFIAAKSEGIVIIDITNPSRPAFINIYNTFGSARYVKQQDEYLYIADGSEGVLILDVSDPGQIEVVSQIDTPGYATHLFRDGSFLYVADDTGLELINLSDIKRPFSENTYRAVDVKPYVVWKKDIYLFVAGNSATLILRHNNPPVLSKIGNKVVDEGNLLTFKVDATDPDGDKLVITTSKLPDGAVLDTLTNIFAWRTITGQHGSYNITFTAVERTNSKLTASEKILVKIVHSNLPPELPPVKDAQILEMQEVVINVPEGSDPDPEDKGKLTYSVKNPPEGSSFDIKTRTFKWKPNYEQAGIYKIVFVCTDAGYYDIYPGVNPRSAEQTSTITVINVNRPPVLFGIEKGGTLISKFDKEIAGIENQWLRVKISGNDPDKEDIGKAKITINNLPADALYDAKTDSFTWLPNFEQAGVYNITFTISDGQYSDTKTAIFRINNQNRPPVMARLERLIYTAESSELKFSVEAIDPDKEDFGLLNYFAYKLPKGAKIDSKSGLFQWIPDYGQEGRYGILFEAKDPGGLYSQDSIVVYVSHTNRPPVISEIPDQAVDEAKDLRFVVNAFDYDKEDQDKLLYTAPQLPEGATFDNIAHLFSWAPNYEQSGNYIVKFTVTDGKMPSHKEVNITVRHINRAPVIRVVQDAFTIEETKDLVIKVSAEDPDKEDKDKVTLTVEAVPKGSLWYPNTQIFRWTPTQEQEGTYLLKFKATDSGKDDRFPNPLTTEKIVTVVVTNLNRPPSLAKIPDKNVNENVELKFTLSAFDPDKSDMGRLVYSVENLPDGAVFDSQLGEFIWTPLYGQAGLYKVKFTVNDPAGATDSKATNINVKKVARPMVVTKLPKGVEINADEDFKLPIESATNDPVVEVSSTNLPKGARIESNDLTFRWKPRQEDIGVYNVTFKLKGRSGTVSNETIRITVKGDNRPPQLTGVKSNNISSDFSKILNAVSGQLLSFKVVAVDPDKEDQLKLLYFSYNLPSGAKFDSKTQIFTWVPQASQIGNFEITFEVSDGKLSETKTLTITVNPSGKGSN